MHGYINSALDKYNDKWVLLYNQIKTNVNRMKSFESIIWNNFSKLSFETKLKFEMSNSRTMWKNLSFLINSAILDNYFNLISCIEAKCQNQVTFCFLQNLIITSISGVMRQYVQHYR